MKVRHLMFELCNCYTKNNSHFVVALDKSSSATTTPEDAGRSISPSPATSPQRARPCSKPLVATPSAPLQTTDDDTLPKRPSTAAAGTAADGGGDENADEMSYIPLQRIVQSKKQKRQTRQKVLKEGWLVHHVGTNAARKRHFWRLDNKSIVMYKDENSTGYYKVSVGEIAIGDIQKQNKKKANFTYRKLLSAKFSTFRTSNCNDHRHIFSSFERKMRLFISVCKQATRGAC